MRDWKENDNVLPFSIIAGRVTDRLSPLSVYNQESFVTYMQLLERQL